MKNMKLRSTCLAVLLGLSLLPTSLRAEDISMEDVWKYRATGASFSDLPGTHWAYPQLINFFEADILVGNPNADNTVSIRPDDTVTRSEFVKLMVSALGLSSNSTGQLFQDVKPGDWFSEPVRVASALGIIHGTSTTQFEPNRPITREEVATVVANAFANSLTATEQDPNFTDIGTSWAQANIREAARMGIVHGKSATLFEPKQSATRAEAVTMLSNGLQREDTNLPSDTDLDNIVETYIEESNNAIHSGELQVLASLDDEYGTAYFKRKYNGIASKLQLMVAQGYRIDVRPTQNRQNPPLEITTVQKSNRFAVLNVKNAAYDYVYSKDGKTTYDFRVLYGKWLLRKTPGGQWKVYSLFDMP
ncbi:S-layer homology domain-containing protein [Tumebacillus sp. ITR2]|uniref:S-layer homology domain-containing protein n=1 Tax=Tumebacillus amylolyticus TaxID=2801339 RepID=A0ABS1JFE1_9BACL|nr:S-layer homology domain-containing protein [Tumebacillus amylolyticus]MBL0388288.1 S-layer homology domain-containing protein [Tumebacillus amylolyticus]